MACIHYRFSFQTGYKFIPFSGLHMTVGDLKAQIMKRERLKSNCDLKICNDQDKEYFDETTLLEKYSCVIVRRIPIRAPVHKTKTADLVSSCFYQVKGGSQKYFGRSCPHRVCRDCGQPGRYVQQCPMMMVKGQSVNAPQKMEMYNGLPQSIKAEEGAKGAMLASTVYKKGLKQNKKRPLFHPPIQPDFKVVSTVPVELMCVICTRLMVDAVIVPCCGYSFCDNCIRTTLIESEEGMCVACQQAASPECIYPNLSLRLAITNFKSNTGYIKCKRRKTETQGDEQQSRSPRHPPSCVSH